MKLILLAMLFPFSTFAQPNDSCAISIKSEVELFICDRGVYKKEQGKNKYSEVSKNLWREQLNKMFITDPSHEKYKGRFKYPNDTCAMNLKWGNEVFVLCDEAIYKVVGGSVVSVHSQAEWNHEVAQFLSPHSHFEGHHKNIKVDDRKRSSKEKKLNISDDKEWTPQSKKN
jgi:hypothetical protein